MTQIHQFYELQQEINDWGRETFPTQNKYSVAAHLYKEAIELLADPDDPGELADVFILTMQIAGLTGVDLLAVTKEKFEILKTRQWGEPDENGVIEHIR